MRESKEVGVTDDVPRRASVAAGDALAHQRSADGGALHRADDTAAVVDRVLGRGDLRCGASVFEGGSVGAAGRAAEAVPNICLQMLLRGRNTVGYTPYPELVTKAFVDEATATGIDIYRIFDALNNVESMRPLSTRCAKQARR